MSGTTHVAEQLAAYALDCLDEAEARQVAEHIAVCAECRAELASHEALVAELALAAPEATPPERLQRRLLAQIRPAHEPAAGTSWWESLTRLFRRTAPAWGLASLVLIIALVATNLLWLQASQDHQPTGMRVIALAHTDAAPGASGMIVVSPDGQDGSLVVDGLPLLDRERQYQLWLISGDQRTSGGVFSVTRDGYGLLYVTSFQPLGNYSSFGITIEPAGGSPGPTGAKVLGGSSF
jgi:anti-sigma-K factor RskA